jgi:predicted nucleic acid-binding protein
MTAPGILYLDSSAIVKLIVSEPESAALFELLRTGGPAVASALAKVEVRRAMKRLEPSQTERRQVEDVLARIALIKIDDSILQQSADLAPVQLRTLDAIHLATALSVRKHLEAFVVYDARLREAAHQLGLQVASPS